MCLVQGQRLLGRNRHCSTLADVSCERKSLLTSCWDLNPVWDLNPFLIPRRGKDSSELQRHQTHWCSPTSSLCVKGQITTTGCPQLL